jgi:hypothetical protein
MWYYYAVHMVGPDRWAIIAPNPELPIGPPVRTARLRNCSAETGTTSIAPFLAITSSTISGSGERSMIM